MFFTLLILFHNNTIMKKGILTVGLVLAMIIAALAQKSEIFKTSDGAIRGYDPVAFFKDNKPVKGNSKFTYTWKGADWFFANQQNLETFKADPEKYAPQFGGYCAYGMAGGHKAPTDTDTWTIVGDKLYFNYNKDVKVMWNKDRPGLITKAEKNWPEIKDKE
jgi:YHS domain-containing protein